MIKLRKSSLLSGTEAAAEVIKALEKNNLVVVQKVFMIGGQVYHIYESPHGHLEAGQIIE